MTTRANIDRRLFLALTAGAGVVAQSPRIATGRELGPGSSAYGDRSPLEKSARTFRAESVTPASRSSRTPLQEPIRHDHAVRSGSEERSRACRH